MMMRLSMAVVGLSAVMLLAGCFSNNAGANGDMDPVPTGLTPADVAQQKSEQLPQAPEVLSSTVRGVVSIDGLTVLDENDIALPPGEFNIGLKVRVVDPGDDILSTRVPDRLGTYELTVASEQVSIKWELEAKVAEDLDGDGEGNDTFLQSIPLTLDPGRVVTVNMAVGLPAPGGADQSEGLQLAEQPEQGEVLVVSYDREDASGMHQEDYALYFFEQLVIYDQDEDGLIDPEEDFSAEDEDNDGWADPYEDNFDAGFDPMSPGGMPDPPMIDPGPGLPPLGPDNPYLEGIVTAVDVEAHTISITTRAGDALVIHISPFTVIDVIAANGTFLNVMLLPDYVGGNALMDVFWTGDGFEAVWVTVELDGIFNF